MPASASSMSSLRMSITSETDVLVAKCLAEVRSLAKLDDEPVLEPLPPLPVQSPRRNAMVLAREAVAPVTPAASAAPVPKRKGPPPLPSVIVQQPPTPPSIVPEPAPSLAIVPIPAPSAARAFASQLPTVFTQPPRRTLASSRAALALCALVAIVAALFAVVRSPLRGRPVVAQTVTVTTAAAHHVVQVALEVIRFGER